MHGLSQITLCVYSRGRFGFFGVGWIFCCYDKKNLGLLSCSILCTALRYINLHFNACMSIFSFLTHTWAHHFWVFCDGCFNFLVVFARPCSLFASFSSLFCLVLASAVFVSMIANHSPQEWWVSKVHLSGCRL